MKRRIFIIFICIGLIVLFLCLLLFKNTKPPIEQYYVGSAKTPATNDSNTKVSTNRNSINPSKPKIAAKEFLEQRTQNLKQSATLWRTPILYYGKVIDESNNPISGVQVSFNTSSVDESLTKEHYDRGTVLTDARGMFKIDGVRGVGMVFQLSHSNYYNDPKNITDYDIRDYPQKGALPNTEQTALVFRMHSKGHPVRLIHKRGGANVPENKEAVTVKFEGVENGDVIGELQLQAWGNTPKNWSAQPYDWGAKLTVPNGGLFEATNQFDFTAPDSGYVPSIELNMPRDQQGWSDSINKSYFLRLPRGFVKMYIHMRAKTPLYVSLDYYYNPDGSQNLEPQ